MHIPFIPHRLEPRYRQICDTAFFSSRESVRLFTAAPQAERSARKRRELITTINRGFASAQLAVIDELLSLPKTKPRTADHQLELAWRKLIDGIAWQVIGGHLYIARRMYRDQSSSSLHHSNFESVRTAAAQIQRSDYANFVLISDLTTFVQIGDLIVVDSQGKQMIVEVKGGAKNAELLEFLHAPTAPQSANELERFCKAEDKKTVDQLRRMLRQTARMTHIAELVNNDQSTDPDSGQTINVNTIPYATESYDSRLDELLRESDLRGWAIDVIDDCLFIGVYAGRHAPLGRAVFTGWLKACGLRSGNPISNILESMVHPLAPPLFSRKLSPDHIFDILFGRKAVFLALHIDKFIAKASENGVPMRWSTRKEAAQMRDLGATKIDHRVPVAVEGAQTRAIGDGVIYRILFHSTRPLSMIAALGDI